jgi:hypothetical protein
MLGAAAARLTAWQQAIVAAVFELCLVGVMVIYELLGHVKQPAQRRIEGVQSQKTLGGDPAKLPPPQGVKRLASPSRRKAVVKPRGSVKSFVRDHVFPADGEQVEIKAGLSRLVCQGEPDTSRRRRIPGRAREELGIETVVDCISYDFFDLCSGPSSATTL